MKKNNLTRSAFAVLLLSSTVVSADQQYPAADFQPEVIYQNSDLIAKSSPAATAKSAPAAKAAAHESPAASSAHDSQYPAADFKPEVLYVDPNYTPSTIVPKASSFKEKETTHSVSAVSESVAAAPAAEKETSTLVYLFGLVAFGLAGFYLFKKPCVKAAQTPAAAPTTIKKSYALNTGVAKYLNKISGTGVSRYIETNVKAASATKATGVAKYVAKQAANPTAAKAATGVDKYVRDRG